jgi:hypothetical protein
MEAGPAMKVTCSWTGKQAYGTLERALIFAAKISTQEGRAYRPYLCPRCGCYHLSSKPLRWWRR